MIEERLKNIEARSDERSQAVSRIESTVNTQQGQINQVVTDMAVLKSQHASFWKGTTILFAVLSLVGGGVGWIISQIFHH